MFVLRTRQRDVYVSGLRCLERGPGFDDGDLIAGPGIVRTLRRIQRLLVGGDRLVENLLEHVLAANLKVIFGQTGLFGEFFEFQIGSAGLGGVLRFVHLVANLAPEIGRPGDIDPCIPGTRP